MEGPDRPLFPEYFPVGLGLPMELYPLALKPFPEKTNPEDLPVDGEQPPDGRFTPDT